MDTCICDIIDANGCRGHDQCDISLGIWISTGVRTYLAVINSCKLMVYFLYIFDKYDMPDYIHMITNIINIINI